MAVVNEKRLAYIVKLCKDFPSAGTMTLAKKAFKEHPKWFKSVDVARQAVRYQRGEIGELHRKSVKKPIPTTKYELPKSYSVSNKPYVIEGKRVLGMFDVHLPYHDIPALEATIAWAKPKKPDTILLGGDIMDCHDLSKFEKDPEARSFKEEREALIQFVKYIQHTFKGAKVIYMEGNHEYRYERFMKSQSVRFLDIEHFQFPTVMKLDEMGVDYINQKRKIRFAGLSIFHGHEFGESVFSPVNVARGLYLRAKASSICGHHHATSEHSERDVNDKLVTTWSVGCLCTLNPSYRPYNKWNHGFVYMERDGNEYNVHNKRILNGRIL